MTSHQKEIGFWRGWGLAVGCAIGSGIFMMPTLLAPYGMLGLYGWLFAGAGAMIIALSLARMARRVPKIGGPYAYAYAGLGKFAGFMIAWSYWLSCVAAVAAISVAFVGYLGYFFDGLTGSNIGKIAISFALVWGVAVVNIKSVKDSSTLTFVTTLLKIIPLLVIIALGFWQGSADTLPEFNPTGEPEIKVIGIVVITVMWSFLGLESATVPADNMVEPEKTIPKVMMASVLTVLVLYLTVSLAIALVVPASDLAGSTAPFALAATTLMGPMGAALIAFGAMISTLSSANANLFAASKIMLAAAKDRLFPPQLGVLNKHGSATISIVISAIFISILLVMNYTKGLVEAFTFMVMLSTLATLLAYAFSSIAELYFLKSEDKSTARTRAIILSIAAFAYSLFAIWGAGAETVMYGFFLLLIGAPFYALVREE